jgi:hypothetical protein
MKSFAIFALVYNVSAVKLEDPGDFRYWYAGRPSDFVSEGDAVKPYMYHWNEDPHSVPDPLNKRGQTFTSTQARYYRDGKPDTDTEVKEINVRYHSAYNDPSTEPNNPTFYDYVQTHDSDSSDDEENVQTMTTTTVGNTVLWHVAPDYGELDDHVVEREADSANGKKHSGWTNPLGWTDDGTGDDNLMVNLQQDVDMVRAQFMSLLQYDESEGPTKADNGEDDDLVLNRKTDWPNPLSWWDNGEDDDTVLSQYDESEGPTKADNGEDDDLILNRIPAKTSALAQTDNGDGDDIVV